MITQNFLDAAQAGLDAVAAQTRVSEGRADAVLREAMWMDAQVAEFVQDGRRLVAVALELDDDEVAHRTLLACGDVIEAQVGIDGKTLGLGLVYQCDAVETVLDLFGETLRGIMKIGTQELVVVDEILILTMELNIVLRMEGVELFHSDTLLLRAAVVILRLHLQETQSGTDV